MAAADGVAALLLAARAYYLLGIAVVFVLQALQGRPGVAGLLAYGKTRQLLPADQRGSANWTARLAAWTVPKRWFGHFYFLGSVWTLLVLLGVAFNWCECTSWWAGKYHSPRRTCRAQGSRRMDTRLGAAARDWHHMVPWQL